MTTFQSSSACLYVGYNFSVYDRRRMFLACGESIIFMSMLFVRQVVQLVARSKSSVVAGASSTSGLSVTAVALPLPTLTEFLLDTASFVVRLLPNFTVIHTESRSELSILT